MCPTTDFHGFADKNRLKIKAFHVRFSGWNAQKHIPESLTLIYLPCVNETELFFDGSNILSCSSAFFTLHRVFSVETEQEEAVFWSREPVRASEGVRFEVYLREDRILEGTFRRDENGKWRLECKCGLESRGVVAFGGGSDVAVAEVCVALEGQVALSEKVEMVLKRKKKRVRRFDRLEAIPEEREVMGDESIDGCCCCCVCDRRRSDSGDLKEVCGPSCERMEMGLEEVRWAVDVGIWVLCIGVGFMLSKASAKSLRRLRIL